MAREFAAEGIAVNCLWARTTIATAATIQFSGGDHACLAQACRGGFRGLRGDA
jgi:hypothetical protein